MASSTTASRIRRPFVGPHRDGLAQLHRRWAAAASPAEGHGAWATTETTGVAAAATSGQDLTAALRALVERRHYDGWTLQEVLDDVAALRAVLSRRRRSRIDWSAAYGRAGVYYAEAATRDLTDARCRDPLTGLPNLGFLAVIVEDLASDPTDLGEHRLLHAVAVPDHRDVARRWEADIALARTTRSLVPRPCVVGSVGPGHVVAVLPPLLDATALSHEVARSTRATHLLAGTAIWLSSLPQPGDDVTAALRSRHPDDPSSHGRGGVQNT